MSETRHSLCSMLHALCSMLYSLFSNVYALYSLWSILYSLFSMFYTLYSVLYSLFSILYSKFSVLYSLFSVLYPLVSILYSLCSVRSAVLCLFFPKYALAYKGSDIYMEETGGWRPGLRSVARPSPIVLPAFALVDLRHSRLKGKFSPLTCNPLAVSWPQNALARCFFDFFGTVLYGLLTFD